MAKEIQLTQGRVALVDANDYEYLSQFTWCAHRHCNTFYAVRNIRLINGKRTLIRMHQDIIGKPIPDLETDHKDGNGLNNRRLNLRHITHRQNNQNIKNIKLTSQFPGVSWFKRDKKWRSDIRINGKDKFLGLFKDEVEAAQAYKNAVEEIGETMISLNKIGEA